MLVILHNVGHGMCKALTPAQWLAPNRLHISQFCCYSCMWCPARYEANLHPFA